MVKLPVYNSVVTFFAKMNLCVDFRIPTYNFYNIQATNCNYMASKKNRNNF